MKGSPRFPVGTRVEPVAPFERAAGVVWGVYVKAGVRRYVVKLDGGDAREFRADDLRAERATTE